MSRSAYLLRLLLLLALAAPMFAEQELTIAAAADLQSAMQEIAARFEKTTGANVKVSFGSSGNFFSQIENGAPFDLFFSADIDYPKKLEAAGLAAPGSLYQYATGKIVLWAPKSSLLDINRGLNVVDDPSLRKLAIANPAHAPYGRAAQAALRKAGLWDKVSPRLVLGENISQTAQFVQSGNADAGVLALSLVLAPGMRDQGRYFEIPQDLYPPLQQAGVILSRSQHKELAARFMDFLKTDEIKSWLKQYGFSTDGVQK
jgi:molybdate transport system substrate-binding protein